MEFSLKEQRCLPDSILFIRRKRCGIAPKENKEKYGRNEDFNKHIHSIFRISLVGLILSF